MTALDGLAAVRCINLYHYNTPPFDALRAVYGEDSHDSYLNSKLEMWMDGITAFMGELDFNHQVKLVELAMDKYLGEVLQTQPYEGATT